MAEKKKKRRGRWSHLQDFYTDLSGKAIYAGKMIRYAGVRKDYIKTPVR